MNKTELRALADDPRHWQFFREFAAAEKALGGPDPQLPTVAKMSEGVKPTDLVWRAGCYIGFYNVPAAEVVWQNWTAQNVRDNPFGFRDWLTEHWTGLPLRRERKAVRSPDKMMRHLVSYAEWSKDIFHRPWMGPGGRYEEAWLDATQNIYGVGRYIALKLLEFYTRYLDAPIVLPDLRPRGGWSPKEALVLFHPDHIDRLLGSENRENLETANMLADFTRRRLTADGVAVSRFDVQVLLCEYKQSYVTRRQYPGRSLDSENAHTNKVEAHFGQTSGIWAARAALFPHVALGEIQGWSGVRKELGTVLRDYGYTWDDSKMDYLATEDLRSPVWRL